METLFAYGLVGSFIFLCIILAFAGLSWFVSAISLLFLTLISPFILLANLFGSKNAESKSQKQAVVSYHQIKYGIIENSRKQH